MRTRHGFARKRPADLQAAAPHAPRPARARGSVLLAVLAVVMLLSFLVTRFMEESVEQLEYRAIFNEPADVRGFAYSMLEISLAVVQEVALIDDGKLHAPEQGWADPLAYAGIAVPNDWEVSVEIRDEGGKLPINTMNESQLNRLLEDSLDFDFGTSRELSSVLLDWIDPDDNRRLNGAESEDYLDRNPPYRAANRPLQSLGELRLLETWDEEFFDENGRPNDLFRQLEGMVSVLNTGPVNLNSAPAPVMESLSRNQDWNPDYIFDGLDEPYLKEPPASADSSLLGAEVGLLRVTVSVRRGQVPFTLSALVEPDFPGDGGGGGGGATGSAPGGAADADQPKTGSLEEQDAIQYPFNILQVSEYRSGGPAPEPARYSTVDIGDESLSF